MGWAARAALSASPGQRPAAEPRRERRRANRQTLARPSLPLTGLPPNHIPSLRLDDMSSTARTQPRSSSFGWGSSSLSRTLARRGPFSSGLTVPADVQAQAAAQIGSGAAANQQAAAAGGEKDAQGRETLFGPVIGGDDGEDEADDGVEEKGRQRERVGVDTVKAWVDKAKANTTEVRPRLTSSPSPHFPPASIQPLGRALTVFCIDSRQPHPTTTLQSLVNLKRPTLHLAPVSASTSAKHSLKFTYDLSAPQALLTLHLYLPTPTPSSPSALTEEVVYQAVVPGGFGKPWALPEDAALDLAACQVQVQDAIRKVEGWQERQTEDDAAVNAKKGGSEALSSPASAEPRRGGPLGRWLRPGRQEDDVESQTVQMTALNLSKGGPDDVNKKPAVRKDVRLVVRLEARGERGACHQCSRLGVS